MRYGRAALICAGAFAIIAAAGAPPGPDAVDRIERAGNPEPVSAEPESVTVEFRALRTQVTRTDAGVVKEYRGDVLMRLNPEVWLTADRAVYSTIAHEARLSGHVAAHDSGRTLHADTVVYLFDEHPQAGGRAIVQLRRNVVVRDSARTVTAAAVDYWPDADSLAARGHVHASMEGGSLRSDTLAYDARTGDMRAQTGVVLIDSTQDVTIRSDRYEYAGATGEALITGGPVLTKGRGDTAVTVSAHYMRYNESTGHAVAWDSVVIERSGLVAWADSLVYDEPAEQMLLYGGPRAVQTAVSDTGETVSETTGDRIVLQLDGSNIRQIRIYGSRAADARALATEMDVSGEISGERWITGREIVFHLDGERVERLDIFGQARSRVVPDQKARHVEGINEASGDTMVITFRGNRMERVALRGGVLGTYWPPADTQAVSAADSAANGHAHPPEGDTVDGG